jgi:hypothetical protein
VSPGGSISEPGLAFLLLHLPILASAVVLLALASSARGRRFVLWPSALFLAYVFAVGTCWAATVYLKWQGAGILVLALLFLMPWPVFIVILVLFVRAKRRMVK